MSIYDNDTSKIYPDINPMASQKLAKKMKRFHAITSIVDKGLIISTIITAGASIAAFAYGVGLSVDVALSGTSLLFCLATVIMPKPFKILTIKQKKHDAIELLAQSNLDSIANIISQKMQDGDIIRYHKRQKNIANLVDVRN